MIVVINKGCTVNVWLSLKRKEQKENIRIAKQPDQAKGCVLLFFQADVLILIFFYIYS
jgi:hypothetical protein